MHVEHRIRAASQHHCGQFQDLAADVEELVFQLQLHDVAVPSLFLVFVRYIFHKSVDGGLVLCGTLQSITTEEKY
jgi:hypothetical protein